MAQLDGMPLNGGNSRTVQQLLHSDCPTAAWNMPSSTSRRLHDQEEEHFPRSKKLSILAKVKEKAKKWRLSLGKKRHGHDDGNSTPSWGVNLEDYEVEEDPEHVGAPIYESEQAPETTNKQKPRLLPRIDPVIPEKNAVGSSMNSHSEIQQTLTMKNMTNTGGPSLTKSLSDQERGKPSIPKTKLKETLTAQSIGNHQRKKDSSSSNDAGKDKRETEKTVEDVTNKSTSYEEKGKRPITNEDDQDEDQEKSTNPKKMVEHEATISNNALEIQEERPLPAKNIAVCEPNHEGTSKIQDLPQTSTVNGASSSSSNASIHQYS